MANKPLTKLNKSHLMFIEEYIANGFNAAAASRKVFGITDLYKSKKRGSVLINDPLIKAEIEKRQKELSKKYEIEKEDIIRDLKDIIDSNILDYLEIETYTDTVKKVDPEGNVYEEEVIKTKYSLKDLSSLSINKQKCIKSIEMTKYGPKIVLYDKDNSYEKLNKLLGFYENIVKVDNRIDTSAVQGLSFEELKKLIGD